MTRRKLADLLGIAPNTVNKWFDSEIVSTRHLALIADYFQLPSIATLFTPDVSIDEQATRVSYVRGYIDGALQHHDDPYWGATVRLGKTDLQLLEQRWTREFQPLLDSAALRGGQLVQLVCSLVHFLDAVRLNRERDRYVRIAITEANDLRRSAVRYGRIGEASYWLKLEFLLRVDGHAFNLLKLGDVTGAKAELMKVLEELDAHGRQRDTDLLSIWVLTHLHLGTVHLADPQAGLVRAQAAMDLFATYEDQIHPFVRIRYLNQRAQLALMQGKLDSALIWLSRGERLLAAAPVISHTEQIDHYLARRMDVLHQLGHSADSAEVTTLFDKLSRRHIDSHSIGGTWMDGYLHYAVMLNESGRSEEAIRLAREVEDALNRFRELDRELESDRRRREVIATIVNAH